MRKLETIAILLFGLAAAAGCRSTEHLSSVKEEESRITDRRAVAMSDLGLEVRLNEGASVDDIEEAANLKLQEIQFRDTYSHYKSELANLFESGDLDGFNLLVQDLGSKLKKDPNPFAQKYFSYVESFSYLIVETVEHVDKTTGTEAKGALPVISAIWHAPVYPIVGALDIIALPYTALFNEEKVFHGTKKYFKSFTNSEDEVKVTGTSFNVYKITPYNGKRGLLGKGVSEKELAQIIDGAKK